MKIHLSSATIQSYENKEKTMDLFFTPIVIFEDFKSFSLEHLQDVKWEIVSNKVGNHEFDINMIKTPAIEGQENRTFVEFRLSKKNVPFEYDNYSCKILFSAKLKPFNEEEIELKHEVLGIVKTKWSKGLL